MQATRRHAQSLWVGLALALTGCALGPDFTPPQTATPVWQAPLPHEGKVANLQQWWAQFNDPLLNQLIAEAEQSSPTLDQAWAKVQEARAGAEGSGGAFLPGVAANLSSTRSQSVFGTQVIQQNVRRAGFDSAWELDILGKTRRTVESATAQSGAAGAQWHAARTSLAAEVADTYAELRQCEATLDLYQQLQQSRQSSLTWTRQKQQAGLTSDSEAARVAASAADSTAALAAKRGDCARSLNKLVALSGQPADTLRNRLVAGHGTIPQPTRTDVSQVAAQALQQRPDVATASFNLAATSADIGVAKASLFPSLTLNGSVGNSRVSMGGLNLSATTWSFGPALMIPLFDGNRRGSQLAAARARYDYADASYRRTVREAVREIEDTLTRLDVANTRLQAARDSQTQLNRVDAASQAREQAGLASKLEREDARRGALQAGEGVLAQQRETLSAWIALYKALGGGWDGKAEPSRH